MQSFRTFPSLLLAYINCFIVLFQSLGNHEFDNGVNGLTPFIENLTTPVLCSNLILTKVPELAREENLKKSIVIDVDGVKVGIIGYLTPDTKFAAVANDVEYVDEIVSMKEEAKKLQSQGVKILIGLGHSGYSKDMEIAREVEGLDLVIGGHTNTFLWNGTSPDSEDAVGPYPTYVMQPSGRSVLVVQAYAYTKYLGKLLLTFDSNGEVINADGSPILLDHTIPQDMAVHKLLDKYRENILSTTEDVIGKSLVILDGRSCSKRECNLGNLITDSMVYKYASDYVGEHWTDAPIAIIQAGGIRTSVAHTSYPTNITHGDLLGVLPFEGNMSAVTMNGTVLMSMLEYAVSKYVTADVADGFLQLSGLQVMYDLNKSIGSRVVKAKARCWACDIPKYNKVDAKGIYKVLMPGFLAKGGDGYRMFKDLETEHLGFSELDCSRYYVSQHTLIYPHIEGRIKFLHDEDESNSSPFVSVSLTSLGNHEFDEGVDGLTPFIRNVTTPVLASNLDLTKVPQLEKEENLKPYIIRNIGGRSIAIIGYLTSETKFLAPTNDVEYKDEVEAIQHYVNLLKKEGVRIFIAVGHSGILKDMEIARKVEGLHLVIGGHSNTFLTNEESDNFPVDPEGPYPLLVTQESGRVVRVVQAYAYTMYLGKLHLVFDDNDEIIDAFGDPILLDNSIPEDPELKKKVDKYRAEMNDSNVIVGSSMESLRGDYCRVRECSMGNLITDAMYNFTESKYPEMCKADVAILQGGRIRTSLDNPEKPFNMYLQDWLSVLPFTDPLTLVTMNGTVLMQVLEHSVSGWRLIDSPGMFLQMSGIKVSYDLGKPSGSRIIEAQARTCRNGLQPIMKETQYKVLMPNFIANGGDGYSMFKDLDMEILAFNEVDSVRYYLSLYSPVNVKETDRIVIKNEDVINKKTMIQLRDEQMNSSQTKALPYSMMCLTAMMVLPQCKYLLNTS